MSNPKKSPPPAPPVVNRKIPIELERHLESVIISRTMPMIALLARYSEVESMADDSGGNPVLEHLAWRAVEHLSYAILKDVETVLRLADVQDSGFATLPDNERDAR